MHDKAFRQEKYRCGSIAEELMIQLNPSLTKSGTGIMQALSVSKAEEWTICKILTDVHNKKKTEKPVK